MADTTDMAPARAAQTTRRAAAGNGSRSRRSRAASDDMEAQVAQLQSDLKAITQTIARMGESKVDEVKGAASKQAAALRAKGEEVVENAQDEFSAFEKQIKDTIREKPLTAVAGAMALGFLIAVITR